MNTMKFQDLVKGCHGRKIAYTDVEQITEDNIVKVIGDCIGVFNYNKSVIKYLWEYYKGDQPVLYRTKLSNEDITNRVVENHSFEWVQFKVAQTYGEPIQFVSRKDDEAVNKAVDELNDYLADANKHEKDIKAGEWQSATGTSFDYVFHFFFVLPSISSIIAITSALANWLLLCILISRFPCRIRYFQSSSVFGLAHSLWIFQTSV